MTNAHSIHFCANVKRIREGCRIGVRALPPSGIKAPGRPPRRPSPERSLCILDLDRKLRLRFDLNQFTTLQLGETGLQSLPPLQLKRSPLARILQAARIPPWARRLESRLLSPCQINSTRHKGYSLSQ